MTNMQKKYYTQCRHGCYTFSVTAAFSCKPSSILPATKALQIVIFLPQSKYHNNALSHTHCPFSYKFLFPEVTVENVFIAKGNGIQKKSTEEAFVIYN